MRPNALRQRWEAGEPALGMWLSSPGSIAAQILTAERFDYACVDLQHGALDYPDLVSLFGAIELGPATPINRVPWNEPGIIGKSLDAGSLGVIVPMVNTRADAEAAVFAARYPPEGGRSHGPVRAVVAHGPDYWRDGNGEVAVIVMIETVEGVANVDDILSTPGVDACYVGPSDLSRSLGLPPGNHDDDPRFADALDKVIASAHNHGVIAGCHTASGLVDRRVEMGFRMVTVTSDLVALRAGLAAEWANVAEGSGSGSMY